MLIGIGACVLLAAAPRPIDGGEPVTARVSTAGLFQSEVIVRAFIEPDGRNRSIAFVVDSPDFYSSSVSPLDGDRAPRSKEVTFRGLPRGEYTVSVVLFGTDGVRGFFEEEVMVR